jgi:hypothetical protein
MTATLAPVGEEQRAVQAMLDHHAELLRGVYERVAELRAAVSQRERYDTPLAALSAYLATEVLPHAAAAEATLYSVAATIPTAELFVEALLLDHAELTSRARSLENVCDPHLALALGDATAALFEVHVRKEKQVLLPALLQVDGVELTTLLGKMHERLGEREAQAQTPDQHGDSACWAHRVCPECGRLNEAERPETCEACGASFD